MITACGAIFAAGLAATSSGAGAPQVSFSEISGNGFGFWFSQPMLTWTGGDIVPAVIEPPLDCTWAWVRDQELACRPKDGAKMQSATRYTVRFFGGLPARSGATLAPAVLTQVFNLPVLVNSSTGWRDGRPTIDLGANLPIDPASLQEVLLVQADDGEVLPFDVTTPPTDAYVPIHAYRLRLPTNVGKRTVTVWLEAGLRTTAGPLPGEAKDEPLVVARFDEPFRLSAARCTRGTYVVKAWTGTEPSLTCRPGSPIKLRFSRRIDDAGVKIFAANLPAAAKLTHATSAEGDAVTIVIDAPNTSALISVPSAMRAANGEAVEASTLLIETESPLDPSEEAQQQITQSAEQAGSR